jgi:hypothetical protein
MLNANSAEAIDSALASAVQSLSVRPDLVWYIQEWGDSRHHFAAYILDSYPGSMGRRGSSPSEQNHSSYVATIGSGFVDDPCVMLEKTILRQNVLNRKRNERISTYVCKSS